MGVPVSLVGELGKGLLEGGLVVALGLLFRGRLSPRVLAILSGAAVLLVSVLTAVPASMSEFSLKSRRTGVENLLRELQRAHPSCFIGGGPCSEADLRAVRGRGCTALNGVVDSSWSQPCGLSSEMALLSKDGGLVIAVFREDGRPYDVWLLRADSLFTVGTAYSSP